MYICFSPEDDVGFMKIHPNGPHLQRRKREGRNHGRHGFQIVHAQTPSLWILTGELAGDTFGGVK